MRRYDPLRETTIRAAGALGLCTLLAAVASAAGEGETDWPQWRGPALDGISRETAWQSVGAEDDLWRAELGIGYSTVSIGGGRLYTAGHDVEAKQDTVWCLDPLTGKELWKHRFAAERMNKFHNGGTLTTPTFDSASDTVFLQHREGAVLALDAATGRGALAAPAAGRARADAPDLGLLGLAAPARRRALRQRRPDPVAVQGGRRDALGVGGLRPRLRDARAARPRRAPRRRGGARGVQRPRSRGGRPREGRAARLPRVEDRSTTSTPRRRC